MFKTIQILGASLQLAWLELKTNKLRTFLSLFGVTIGIFCIIGVLTTVTSLEQNIKDDINSLGSNTIYIDKWSYSEGGDGDYPWWKFVKRPEPKFEEVRLLREKSDAIENIAFTLSVSNQNVVYGKEMIQGVELYGVTEDFDKLQPFEIEIGRYLNSADFDRGSANGVIGYENAVKLFGQPESALGKAVIIKNKRVNIVGVTKKKGKSLMVSGWNFDDCVIFAYRFFRTVFDEKHSGPTIMVQGKSYLNTDALKDDLTGSMRAIHRLKPGQEDDFSLNAVSDFTEQVSSLFASIKIGGWLIGLLSLIVGAFGIANIMFVTVRERTPVIGLKKAIGAKKQSILIEFLLESSFICLIGGLIGMVLVYAMALLLSGPLNFNVHVSYSIVVLAFSICILIGVLAGIVPANMAAKMDAVVAIRSK